MGLGGSWFRLSLVLVWKDPIVFCGLYESKMVVFGFGLCFEYSWVFSLSIPFSMSDSSVCLGFGMKASPLLIRAKS